jgi:hypothetical protein
MARPAGDDLPPAEVRFVDGRDHQRHPTRSALFRCVELPVHRVGAGIDMAFHAVEPQRRRHDAHGVHEIVHRDAFEHLHVREDVLGHGWTVLARRLGRQRHARHQQAYKRENSDTEFHNVPKSKPYRTN